MGDVLAIVSKAIFEREARDGRRVLGVGDIWPTERYLSRNVGLKPLDAGGDLYLATVRPQDTLWIVAVLQSPVFDGDGWAAPPNRGSIVDVTALVGRLRFTTGTGIAAGRGRLAMSLQTPRTLTAADSELLAAALPPVGPAFEWTGSEQTVATIGRFLYELGSGPLERPRVDALVAGHPVTEDRDRLRIRFQALTLYVELARGAIHAAAADLVAESGVRDDRVRYRELDRELAGLRAVLEQELGPALAEGRTADGRHGWCLFRPSQGLLVLRQETEYSPYIELRLIPWTGSVPDDPIAAIAAHHRARNPGSWQEDAARAQAAATTEVDRARALKDTDPEGALAACGAALQAWEVVAQLLGRSGHVGAGHTLLLAGEIAVRRDPGTDAFHEAAKRFARGADGGTLLVDAERAWARALDLDARQQLARDPLGAAESWKEAIVRLKVAVQHRGAREAEVLALLLARYRALREGDRPAEAVKVAKEAAHLAEVEESGAGLDWPRALALAGRVEHALDALELLVGSDELTTEGLRADPDLAALRDHPRFIGVLHEIGGG